MLTLNLTLKIILLYTASCVSPSLILHLPYFSLGNQLNCPRWLIVPLDTPLKCTLCYPFQMGTASVVSVPTSDLHLRSRFVF